MANNLDVYLHNELIGRLTQRPGGGLQFHYVESWLDNPSAVPLSQSLPLRAARFPRRECQGFFAGVLPDEAKRETIARNLGISARNDYAMLERIGGECAGAVTFLPSGQPLPARNDSYRTLSVAQLTAILKELPKRPLLAGDEGIRLSLAGAQDKIAVRIEDGQVCLPLGGAPSTHILKPAVDRFEDVVCSAALCMNLAAEAGLPAAAVTAKRAQGIDYLLVERYDRIHRQTPGTEPVLERLHQEDFCQALGLVPEHKYQQEGGPSLKQCFHLLREVSSSPVVDLLRLLEAVIFNYLVGNNDAHGKNFSLLYHGRGAADRTVRLAPLYDVVNTAFYPELSRGMAMRIGTEYLPEKVTAGSFQQLAEEAGLGKPLVRARVPEMAERVLAALERVEIATPAAEQVAALIRGRSIKVRDSFRR